MGPPKQKQIGNEENKEATLVIQAACSVKNNFYNAINHPAQRQFPTLARGTPANCTWLCAMELFVGCPVPEALNPEAACVGFLHVLTIYIYIYIH